MKFEQYDTLRNFRKFHVFMKKLCESRPMNLARLVSSTSHSGGKQVDDLPPASSTETVAKPARLGPAQHDTTSKKIVEFARFWMMKYMKR